MGTGGVAADASSWRAAQAGRGRGVPPVSTEGLHQCGRGPARGVRDEATEKVGGPAAAGGESRAEKPRWSAARSDRGPYKPVHRLPTPVPARLLLFLAVVAGGCDADATRACTLVGCDDALFVVVAGPDGALAPGQYGASVSSNLIDQEPATCAFAVTASGDVESDCQAFAAPDEPGVTVRFPPVAGSVTVDVERDGARVARLGAEPAYVGQFPNGPDCGEVCQQATVRVRIP